MDGRCVWAEKTERPARPPRQREDETDHEPQGFRPAPVSHKHHLPPIWILPRGSNGGLAAFYVTALFQSRLYHSAVFCQNIEASRLFPDGTLSLVQHAQPIPRDHPLLRTAMIAASSRVTKLRGLVPSVMPAALAAASSSAAHSDAGCAARSLL